MSGMELSNTQDMLAVDWIECGPERVYNCHVSQMPRELLERLVMANIGKRAQDLEQA